MSAGMWVPVDSFHSRARGGYTSPHGHTTSLPDPGRDGAARGDASFALVEATYTVAELNQAIGRVVARAFPDEVWVEGEIRDLARSRNGHVYFTLVDAGPAEPGQPPAVLRVALFAADRAAVNRVLMRTGAMRMTDGVHVRIRGRVVHYAGRGTVQLRMTWIDTDYTMGKLAAERLALLRRLEAEGLLDRNAARELPPVPLRVGLVTSVGSAAHADFLTELAHSGYAFRVAVADARTQGPEAAASLVRGLGALAALGCDVVALVRGGGAQTDLAAFDAETVARAIAAAPFPVYTGIGHEVDTTVADSVAARSLKTPTACAGAVVEAVRGFEGRVDAAAVAVVSAAIGGAERAAIELTARSARLVTAARLHVVRHERSVTAATAAVRRKAPSAAARAAVQMLRIGVRAAGAARYGIATAEGHLAETTRRLRREPGRRLAVEERRLGGLASIQRAHEPGRMLARGWSLTYAGETLVRGPEDVAGGDRIRTITVGGVIRSVVERENGDGDDRGK